MNNSRKLVPKVNILIYLNPVGKIAEKAVCILNCVFGDFAYWETTIIMQCKQLDG